MGQGTDSKESQVANSGTGSAHTSGIAEGSITSLNRNWPWWATLPQAGDVCVDILGGHLADTKGEWGSIVAFTQTALPQLPPLF